MDEGLRFNGTSGDQVEALLAGMADTDLVRRQVRNTRIFLGLTFGGGAVLLWYWSFPIMAGFYLVAALLLVVFSPRITTWTYRRRLTKVASRDGLGSLGLETLAITDEGLKYESAGGNGLVKWTEIKGVYESTHTYALRMSGTMVLPIPKKTESGDAADFIADVRKRTGL